MTVATIAIVTSRAPQRGFAAVAVQRRHLCHRHEEPPAHREQHGGSQRRTAADQELPDLRPDVDERRAGREDRAHEQPDGDRDLEAGERSREEDVCGPDGVKPQEAPGRHEGQREQQDPRVTAAVGRFTGRVAEDERHGAGDAEDDEVQPVVLDVRVELGAEQQRDEPDEGQRDGRDSHREDRTAPRPAPGRGGCRVHGGVDPAALLSRFYRRHGGLYGRSRPSVRHGGVASSELTG